MYLHLDRLGHAISSLEGLSSRWPPMARRFAIEIQHAHSEIDALRRVIGELADSAVDPRDPEIARALGARLNAWLSHAANVAQIGALPIAVAAFLSLGPQAETDTELLRASQELVESNLLLQTSFENAIESGVIEGRRSPVEPFRIPTASDEPDFDGTEEESSKRHGEGHSYVVASGENHSFRWTGSRLGDDRLTVLNQSAHDVEIKIVEPHTRNAILIPAMSEVERGQVRLRNDDHDELSILLRYVDQDGGGA